MRVGAKHIAAAVSLFAACHAFQRTTIIRPKQQLAFHRVVLPPPPKVPNGGTCVTRGRLPALSASRNDSSTLAAPNRRNRMSNASHAISQWLMFGGVVAGMCLTFFHAARHQWLHQSAATWKLLAIGYPAVVLFGSMFYIMVYFRQASGGAFVVKAMNGVENRSRDLEVALEQVYERSALTKKPTLYVVPSSEPNAFAAGTKENCVVAVTLSLMDLLTLSEVRAVLAHEIGHIQSRHVDSSLQTAAMIAALGLVTNLGRLCLQFSRGRNRRSAQSSNNDNEDEDRRGTNLFAVGVVLMIVGCLSSLCGTLIRLASSRSNEFEADAFAKSVGAGPDLISALQKLGRLEVTPVQRDLGAKGLGALGGAYAHAYISNPPSRESPMISLFGLLRTHPSMEKRIERLLER